MQTKTMSKHTNHSTNEPENLHVNQFSSELVHRHIIYLLTLLLLLKWVVVKRETEKPETKRNATSEVKTIFTIHIIV